MRTDDETQAALRRSGEAGGGDLLVAEQELLARVKAVSQRITRRVREALSDTDAHKSLPTEETPRLP